MKGTPVVLGVDPSLSGTGLTLLDLDGNVISATCLKTKITHPASERLHELTEGIQNFFWNLTDPYGPDFNVIAAVIEDLPNSGMSAGKLGMAQGVVRLEVSHEIEDYVTVVASTVKKYATGKGSIAKGLKGKARKEPMLAAFEERFGYREEDDNIVDSAFMACMALDMVYDNIDNWGIEGLIGRYVKENGESLYTKRRGQWEEAISNYPNSSALRLQ